MSSSRGDDATASQLLSNVRMNAWPLLIISAFAFVFTSFLTQGQRAPGAPEERPRATIRLGLCKPGSTPTYFKTLESELTKALTRGNKYEVKVSYAGDMDELCKQLRSDEVDVAGEFTPIEYVNRYRTSRFSPLVSIEYENTAYYRSILFVPHRATVGAYTFVDEPGVDNLATIRDMISECNALVVHREKASASASGYYYPRSHLLDHDIEFKHTQSLNSDDQIFLDVLTKKDNNLVAGWLADFRFKARKERIDEERQKRRDGEEGEQPEFADCADPFVVDKSDPIPHGVFVVSDSFRNNPAVDLPELIGIWKTVRGVRVGEGGKGPEITGWRTGVEGDLERVEFHKNKVYYAEKLASGREWLLAVVVVILILLISGVTLFVTKRSGL